MLVVAVRPALSARAAIMAMPNAYRVDGKIGLVESKRRGGVLQDMAALNAGKAGSLDVVPGAAPMKDVLRVVTAEQYANLNDKSLIHAVIAKGTSQPWM